LSNEQIGIAPESARLVAATLAGGPAPGTIRRVPNGFGLRLCSAAVTIAGGMTVPAPMIFDLDGVLVDSEVVWNDARRQLVEEVGGTWRDDARRATMGISSVEWSRWTMGLGPTLSG
jgi:hypothetical protein